MTWKKYDDKYDRLKNGIDVITNCFTWCFTSSSTLYWTWPWEATSSPMAASTSATRSRGRGRASSRCSPSGRRDTNGIRRGTRTARTTPSKSTTSASTISIFPTLETTTGTNRTKPTPLTTISHTSNRQFPKLWSIPRPFVSVFVCVCVRVFFFFFFFFFFLLCYGRCVTASTNGDEFVQYSCFPLHFPCPVANFLYITWIQQSNGRQWVAFIIRSDGNLRPLSFLLCSTDLWVLDLVNRVSQSSQSFRRFKFQFPILISWSLKACTGPLRSDYIIVGIPSWETPDGCWCNYVASRS